MSTVKESSHIAIAHLKIIRQDLKAAAFLEDKKRQRHALKVLCEFASSRASRDNVNFCRKNFEFALLMNV